MLPTLCQTANHPACSSTMHSLPSFPRVLHLPSPWLYGFLLEGKWALKLLLHNGNYVSDIWVLCYIQILSTMHKNISPLLISPLISLVLLMSQIYSAKQQLHKARVKSGSSYLATTQQSERWVWLYLTGFVTGLWTCITVPQPQHHSWSLCNSSLFLTEEPPLHTRCLMLFAVCIAC